MEKQMDEVRRIVLPKLKPFHFQIKTYYLSDANYPTHNPHNPDNPSLVWFTANESTLDEQELHFYKRNLAIERKVGFDNNNDMIILI